MKKNLAPLVGIALVVAFAATGVFYMLLSSRLQPATQASSGSSIVMAARAIAPGTTIGRDDVKLTAVTGKAPEALVTLDQAVGKVAISPIAVGDPVSSAKVASSDGGGGVGIPVGMRAISIQVADSSGILNAIKPGHHVDVQAVQARDTHDVELRTIAEDIEVMKVGPPDPANGKSNLPIATLLVTPEEANTIALADISTRVRLSLRNPLDRGKVTSPVLHITTVMRGNRWAPAPVPAGTRPAAAVAKK